jgi:CheY-like chemotaxis protein
LLQRSDAGAVRQLISRTSFEGNLTDMQRKQARVLVAEDNDAVRRIVVSILSEAFDVIAAVRDGEQVIQSANWLLPDVIVSDMNMMSVDGPAARDNLIAQGLAIPFVFVSSLAQEDMRLVPKESVVACVYKGEMPFHLNKAVDAVLSGQSYFSPYYRE